MKTPLNDAVEKYLKEKPARFHTPGHQGVLPEPFTNIAAYDVTETKGLDDLYNANGAIRKTEKGFEEIYGSFACLLSAGGSTLCVQTMMAVAVPVGGKVLISRDVHASAINAMALLDITPIWVYPNGDEKTGLLAPVTPKEIEEALKENGGISAVYITSPTYYGINSDIRGISAVCKNAGVPLLVDAAQGAHYKFFASSKFALDLGADICCTSLHKTLPTMTGAALLHLGKRFSSYYKDAKEKMAIFGSTSPSYPIMLSADRILPYLAAQADKDLEKVKIQVDIIRNMAEKAGFLLPKGDLDPIRLTLGYGAMGYSESEIQSLLAEYKIEPEYIDDYYFILLAGVNNTTYDWEKVAQLVTKLKKKNPRKTSSRDFPKTKKAISIRSAMFSSKRRVAILVAGGKTAGGIVAPCPPGIPILIPGEIINSAVLEQLRKHRIMLVSVL